MHFASIESVQAAWAALPQVVGPGRSRCRTRSSSSLGVFGIALLVLRDRWFGWLLVLLGVVNVYFYANYLGNLSHYLLTSWLILAIGLAYAGETVVEIVVRRGGPRLAWVAYALLIMPAVLLASNWATHDQSANHDGERFTTEVFAALPQDSVLLTYWDALDAVELQALRRGRPTRRQPARLRREGARDLRSGRTAADRGRPPPAGLRAARGRRFDPGRGPASCRSRSRTFVLPWGQRYPELDRKLYRLVPPDQAP